MQNLLWHIDHICTELPRVTNSNLECINEKWQKNLWMFSLYMLKIWVHINNENLALLLDTCFLKHIKN